MAMPKITKKYRVEFNVPELNSVIELTRSDSAAFRYGNNTAVEILRIYDNGSKNRNLYDSRYDKNVDDFEAWCQNYLEGVFDPKYEPKVTKID